MPDNSENKTSFKSLENKKILEYFNKCKDSIDATNRYMLRRSCMYIGTVLIFMLFLATLIVPDFKISIAHLLLIPLLGIYFLINLYIKTHNNISSRAASFLCILFYFILFILFIYRDMTSITDHEAMWFPLYLVVFPTVYISRMYKYGLFEFVLFIIFCISSYLNKSPDVFRKDVYIAVAAYVLSMLSAHIILEVRSQEGLAIEELTKISTIDKLTYLLNKGALLSAINNYFDRRKPGDPCGMCIIDVDNFKQVNDNFGHGIGDKLLSNIGDLLRKNFRESDYIGRFGGDEFIVFLPGIARLDIIEMRCRTMQMMLSDLDLGTGESFTLSIGAIIDTGDHGINEVFRMTDDALYQSKLMGKNTTTAWIVPKSKSFDKPLVLFAYSKDNPNAEMFIEKYDNDFSIIHTHSGDTALTYLSQYQDIIKLAIIDLDIEKTSGDQVVHYIKERAGFNHIPIIAIAANEDSFVEARNAGADKVFLTGENTKSLKKAVDSLIN